MKLFNLILPFLPLILSLSDEFKPIERAFQEDVDRYNGEYGLYVYRNGDQVEVRWNTEKDSQGLFEVYFDGNRYYSDTTGFSRFHVASFSIEEEGTYQLKYGDLENTGDQHLTAIRSTHERASYDVKNADSVFVLSDIHGQYDNFKALLQNNGLVDEEMRWIGGSRHLLIAGDLFDRGKDVTKLLWTLYRLEEEVEAAGGGLHIVLGNHEIMTFSGDLRYVSRKERVIASFYGIDYGKMYSIRNSLLAQWLASKPSVMRIDGLLVTHGGMITNYGDYSLKVLNDSIHAFMQEPVFEHIGRKPLDTINFVQSHIEERQAFFYGRYSPFWFRGYIQSDTLASYIDHILRQYKCTVHVVGHTTLESMTQFYKGKVICVDVQQEGERAVQLLLLVRKKRNRYTRKLFDIDGREMELPEHSF